MTRRKCLSLCVVMEVSRLCMVIIFQCVPISIEVLCCTMEADMMLSTSVRKKSVWKKLMALLWVTRDAKGLPQDMLLVHGSAEALGDLMEPAHSFWSPGKAGYLLLWEPWEGFQEKLIRYYGVWVGINSTNQVSLVRILTFLLIRYRQTCFLTSLGSSFLISKIGDIKSIFLFCFVVSL